MATEYLVYSIESDAYRPESFSLKVQDTVLISQPGLGGPLRTFELPGQWLVATITYAEQRTDERAEIAGFWAAAGLMKNRVMLHHLAMPIPRGTARGNPQMLAAAAIGAQVLSVGNLNGTLARGDVIGTTAGIHVVTAPVVPVQFEAMVPISPQVRYPVAGGSAVLWERPTAAFVVTSIPEIVFRGAGPHPGFSVQLVQV